MLDRREFLASAMAAGVGLFSSSVTAAEVKAGKRLRVAFIGCGSRSQSVLLPNIAAVNAADVVAFVDPDQRQIDGLKGTLKRYNPTAPLSSIATYSDYRTFYKEMAKEVDAVFIATPNHQHALPALLAFRNGIHAYVEKPMAYTVAEGRQMLKEARENHVMTQMGQHGHSNEAARRLCEYVWAGAIGQVTEVYCWTNRLNARSMPLPGPSSCPAHLDWESWLGPASSRPYQKGLHPMGWYSWRDFGSATIGNMGNHVIDPVYWALRLGSPESVQLADFQAGAEGSWGVRDHIIWKFPKRGDLAPVEMHWYDGVREGLSWGDSTWTKGTYKMIARKADWNLPPKWVELEKRYNVNLGPCGAILIGEKGVLAISVFGEVLRFVPDALRKELPVPPKTIPRIRGSHQLDFLRACQGGPAACSNFEYAQPLNELVLLGVAAIEENSGRVLKWDGAAGRFSDDAANRWISKTARKGWEL